MPAAAKYYAMIRHVFAATLMLTDYYAVSLYYAADIFFRCRCR